MLFMEEELKAWEKEGRDIWGWVATSERLAIVHAVDDGEGREGRGGRTSAGVRLVNEAVVVKGREYQGNVFGGFRRSTILGCYDNRGRRTAVGDLVVAVAGVIGVVSVVTKVRKRKAKRKPQMGWLYPASARTRCQPLLQIRNM